MEETRSCYKGAFRENWNLAISALIHFNQEMLPRLTIINELNVTVVHPDFPVMEGAAIGDEVFEYRRIIDQTINAADFIICESSRIVPTEENNRESFALSKFKSVVKLLPVLSKRIEVYGKYLATFTDSKKLGAVTYSGDTALAMLLHNGTKDQSLKDVVVDKMLSQYQDFTLLRNKWKSTASIFEQASKKLATIENLVYNEHFNKNTYLNYQQYKNETSKFLSHQNIYWGELINYLNAAKDTKGETINNVKPFFLKTIQAHIRQANKSNKEGSASIPANTAIADIANINIITHSLAKKAGYTGQPTQIKYTPLFGEQELITTTMVYDIEIQVSSSNSIYIQAYGTEDFICRSKRCSDEWIQNTSISLGLAPSQILNEEKSFELLIGTKNAFVRHQFQLHASQFQEKHIIITAQDFERGAPINYYNISNACTLNA